MIGDILGFLGFSIALVVAVGIAGFVWLRAYYSARRKGYGPAISYWIIFGAGAMAILAMVFWNFWWWGMVLAPLTLPMAIVAFLPRKKIRHSGARKLAFLDSKFAAWVVGGAALGGVVCILTGWVGWWLFPHDYRDFLSDLVKTGCGLLGVPAWYLHLKLRASLPTLEEAVRKDLRPPVLYLRAFREEGEGFTWGPKEEMAKYMRQTMSAETWPTVSVTLEEFLGEAIDHEVGPFVALGNPEDQLPPVGASRRYADDGNWQPDFQRLAEEAGAIVVEVSGSQNLQWELAEIRRRGWHQKLFVITRPVPRPNWAIYRWGTAAIRAARGSPAPVWADFAANLSLAGFKVECEPPGAGSVVGFDAVGSAAVVKAGARLPGDFADALRRAI